MKYFRYPSKLMNLGIFTTQVVWHRCHICGKLVLMDSDALGGHIKGTHRMKEKEYKEQYCVYKQKSNNEVVGRKSMLKQKPSEQSTSIAVDVPRRCGCVRGGKRKWVQVSCLLDGEEEIQEIKKMRRGGRSLFQQIK